MNEGLEQRFTIPSPPPPDGSFIESAPFSSTEIQFTDREQELLAKLIAEGKSEAIQIAEYDAKFGPPKKGYYALESYSLITPYELDELIRSLKERNIQYTDLPEDALSAIYRLGLFEQFESGRVSAVTDKNLKEGRPVFSAPLYYQEDDLENWDNYKDPKKSAEIRRDFFLNQIQKIESIYMLKMRWSQEKSKLDRNSENFVEEMKNLDDSIESLNRSIRSICDNVVNYVNTSGVSFEDLFPDVSEDLHLFIYKTSGGVSDQQQPPVSLAA